MLLPLKGLVCGLISVCKVLSRCKVLCKRYLLLITILKNWSCYPTCSIAQPSLKDLRYTGLPLMNQNVYNERERDQRPKPSLDSWDITVYKLAH